ncbi:ATP-binding protein [Priestia aryabhattai]|uniref:ATP-binding protein n=1 Tax=Priestia aryabhattai TaxID=412384 RepID=UPI000532C3A0|nr:ATP-binding protein [Priestia aryabhattai]
MALLEKYQNQFNEGDLRAEVQEIVRSYRHSWDIYSELIQNSIDAINRRFKVLNDPTYYLYEEFRSDYGPIEPDPDFRGTLEVKWDKDNNTLTIMDNGIGMEKDKMETYLLPKGSGKKIGKDYGFKGYGFTFSSFVSEKVSINSKFLASVETNQISFEGCFNWLAMGGEFPTGPIHEPIISTCPITDKSGTSISIKLSHNYAEFFPAIASLDDAINIINTKDDVKKLEYLLRTRTAIGNTRHLFGQEPSVPVDVELVIVIDGQEHRKPIKYNFQHPKEHREVSVLSYDFGEYVQNLANHAFQRDFRALYHSVKDQEVGTIKKVKFNVALCAISQTRLNNIESDLGIPNYSDFDLTYGIHLAINGMPTGIRIDNWETGGGYLKRYYVIVDTDLSMSEQLDSGRKGISKHFANLISKEVIKLLGTTKIQTGGNSYSSSFGHFALSQLDSGRVTGGDTANDDFQTMLGKIDTDKQSYTAEDLEVLGRIKDYSSLMRIPKTEQEVIVLFYHLLEKEIIKGYKTEYVSGVATYDAALSYKLKLDERNDSDHDLLGVSPAIVESELSKGREYYDLANFRRDRSSELCVEFKQNLGGFLQEIQGKTEKDPASIDILICWDKQIPASIPTSSYTLGEVHDSQRKYHGTTHRLGIIGPENNTEIYCIILKDALEKLHS